MLVIDKTIRNSRPTRAKRVTRARRELVTMQTVRAGEQPSSFMGRPGSRRWPVARRVVWSTATVRVVCHEKHGYSDTGSIRIFNAYPAMGVGIGVCKTWSASMIHPWLDRVTELCSRCGAWRSSTLERSFCSARWIHSRHHSTYSVSMPAFQA